MWYDIFTTPSFYLMLGLVSLFAYGVIRGLVSRIPVVNSILKGRTNIVLFCALGFLITSGGISALGLGSVTKSVSSGVLISDLQVTTDFAGNCTISENSNIDDLVDVRCLDANTTETAGDYELKTGVITVTRGGDLSAMSCPVVASTQRQWQSEKTPGDGNLYTIVETTTLGELEVYLTAASSTTAATTSSPKQNTQLAFAEGAALGYVGVLIEVDETAHDQLNQYSYKDVVVNICGKPFTFRIHRMD
jgi:hypothetical protein